MSEIKPIFLLSLPRSGSTLVQRVIAAHPKVSTVSEPWLLLPMLNLLRDDHIFTDYSHATSRKAIIDFIKKLPNKEEDIFSGLNSFLLGLYSKLSFDKEVYFLDKTPRYHLICHLLPKIFPHAKFVILWRNPLAIASSMIQTWENGRWNLFRYKVDLYQGFDNLYNFKIDNINAFNINYESLLNHEESLETWENLFEYLELQFEPRILEKFTDVELTGKMGDPKRYKYTKIVENDKSWESSFGNFIRRRWAQKYLIWIGENRLKKINYDMDLIMRKIPQKKIDINFFNDMGRLLFAEMKPWIEPYIFKTKIKEVNKKILLSHS